MIVKSISLTNFRNHKSINVDLHEGINVIFGSNGIGKTNIVESIYYISYLKSFRTSNDRDLINYDSEFTKIDVKTSSNYSVIISKNSKKCLINGSLYNKQSEFIGNLKSVVFSPETIDLLIKSPSERRKYIDMLICMVDSTYVYVIKEFNHLIKQRNDYLRKVAQTNNLDKIYLDVLNEKFISLSEKIYKKRFEIISELSYFAKTIFNQFFDFSFDIVYEIQSGIDLNNIRDTLLQKLESRYERELYLGSTTTGPTRDDLVFLVDNHNAKIFASKGQQRAVLISLKLAEVEVIKKYCNCYPILILDDVLSELDSKRQNYLFEVLSNRKIQSIITTTDLKDIKIDNKFNKIKL